MSVQQTVTIGLLSPNHRAFLRGDAEDITSNPDQYESNMRHVARERLGMLRLDLALLEAHGHDDIVAEFYHEVDRIERLRREIGTYGATDLDHIMTDLATTDETASTESGQSDTPAQTEDDDE